MTGFVSKPRKIGDLNLKQSLTQEFPCFDGTKYNKTNTSQVRNIIRSSVLQSNYLKRTKLQNVESPNRITIPDTSLNFYFQTDSANDSNDLDFSVLFTMGLNSVVTIANGDDVRKKDLNIYFKAMFDALDPNDSNLDVEIIIAVGGYNTGAQYRQVFTKDTTTPFVLKFQGVLELPAIATASLNTTTGDDRPLRLIALVQDY
jgi:hypothetical protein